MVPPDPILLEIVDRLTESLSVQRIILFGSRVHGEAAPESDYDIAVVWDTPLARLSRTFEVRKLLVDVSASLDVVCLTTTEFDAGAGVSYPVWRDIREHGRTLFDARREAA